MSCLALCLAFSGVLHCIALSCLVVYLVFALSCLVVYLAFALIGLALWSTLSLPLHFLAFKCLTLALSWSCFTFSPDLVSCSAGQVPSSELIPIHLGCVVLLCTVPECCFPRWRGGEWKDSMQLVAPYWTTQPCMVLQTSTHNSWLSFSTFQAHQYPAVATQKCSSPTDQLEVGGLSAVHRCFESLQFHRKLQTFSWLPPWRPATRRQYMSHTSGDGWTFVVRNTQIHSHHL